MQDNEATAVKDEAGQLVAALGGIAFDLVIFFEHARDDQLGKHQPLFCPRLVIGADGSLQPWPQRWRPVLPDMENWARNEKPWLDNLEVLARDMAREAAVPISELPGVQVLVDRGIHSLLCLAIEDGGRFVASIVLCARAIGAYGKTQHERLTNGRAAAAVRKLLDARRRRRDALIHDMRNCFTSTLAPDELARELTKRLATELDWDYVGIYRVETRFVLVADCDRTNSLRLEPEYQQDLDKGLLGSTLREGVCLRVDDVTVKSLSYGYLTMEGFPAKSALCYPIKVGGRIEWLLDCESVALAAFQGPDRELLDRVVEGLQSMLDLWFEYRLSHAILDALSQPVLVADLQGKLQRANQSARDLLGLATGPIAAELADFAFDDETREVLAPIRELRGERVRLRTAFGQCRPMLATVGLSGRAFGRWLIQFVDADEQQMLSSLQYARTTVGEVASQARGPLMLANALLNRVRSAVGASDLPEIIGQSLKRINDNLAKADISYERLARALSGKEQIPLHALIDQMVATLPGNVRLNIDPVMDASVRCDAPAVAKAFSAVLLRVSEWTAGAELHLSSKVRDDHVTIDLDCPAEIGTILSSWDTDFDPIAGVSAAASSAAGSTDSWLSDPSLSELAWLRIAVAADGGRVETTTMRLEVQLLRAAASQPQGLPR
jgi:putative methionine-R-sulfoxide reductase with GAF domain